MLKDFLTHAKTNKINKVFVYFKNEKGELENIGFQNGVFFSLTKDKQVYLVNPIRVMETMEKIKNKELKIVGSGCYQKEVSFNNYFKGEKEA